jgi:hypothetical protein
MAAQGADSYSMDERSRGTVTKGHLLQRGRNSFRLKFDVGNDERTGERKTQSHTFRGTKRQAQVKLAELIASVAQSKYVEPNRIVATFVRDRVDHWEAAGDISARTADATASSLKTK